MVHFNLYKTCYDFWNIKLGISMTNQKWYRTAIWIVQRLATLDHGMSPF